MFAVIELKGHQYIIQPWAKIQVDRMEEQEDLGAKVLAVFDQDGSTVKVGKPFVSWVKIGYEIAGHSKGDKVRVLKFKRKNRYERNIGFRKHLTDLHIKSIDLNG